MKSFSQAECQILISCNAVPFSLQSSTNHSDDNPRVFCMFILFILSLCHIIARLRWFALEAINNILTGAINVLANGSKIADRQGNCLCI